MAQAAPAAGAPKVSRLDRRKARTRKALIDAAVRLIAEGRGAPVIARPRDIRHIPFWMVTAPQPWKGEQPG